MLNIRELCSLLTVLTVLWTSIVPLEAKTKKGDKAYKIAQRAEQSNDHEKALEQYEVALKEDPSDVAYQMGIRRARFAAAAARIDRGQRLREQGKPEEALLEFERAFLIDPSSSIAVQEVKRTKAMVDYQRKMGSTLKDEDKGLTPSQAAKRQNEEKIATIQPVAELKPLSRQVTSLKMNNQNVKVLYETLGKLTGINVIWDPEYQQPSKNYNVDLTNTNLEEALDHLSVMTKTYWKALSSNTIFLTNDNITKRRDYEDNVVKVFYLQNITSVQELNEIATSVRSVTEIRRLYTYNGQNAVIARGTVDQVALVEKLLTDLDKPKAEVLVDIIVMETSTGRTRDLAASVLTSGAPGLKLDITPTTSDGKALGGLSLPNLKTLRTDDYTVNLPSALLQAVMTDRNSKVRQTPQIRAADGQKASLRIGEKVPTASGSFQPGIGTVGVSPLVNTQFQYLDVGVVMDMTPRIHGDDEVSMHVEIEISNVVERIDIGGIKQPVIGQRKVVHDVRVKEGEMNLIGGLVKTLDTRNVSGIPGLMNIPYLGRLFSTESIERSQNELVIALVPHIVRTQEITPVNLRGIFVGNDQTAKLSYARTGGDAAAPSTAPTTPVTTTPTVVEPTPAKPQLPPAAPVRLTFQPEGVVTRSGSEVVVTLHVAEAVDLFQAPVRFKYDPKKLKLQGVTPGAFLSSDGQRVTSSHDDNVAKGEIAVQLSRVAGAPGLTGNGALLSLRFMTLTAGDTTVAVLDSALQNAKLQTVPAQSPSVGVEIR